MKNSTLRIEKLEDRILLAGNVTAVQNGSQLVINGDADDNFIVVTNDGGAGTIEVSEADGGTVNGGGPETFAGITHIVIRGRAGDDIVIVDDIDIEGNLTIQLNQDDGDGQGAGVFTSNIGGNLAISSDGDADVEVGVFGNNVGGAAQIVTRGGDDDIEVEDGNIGGQLVINAGHGDNDVFLGGFEGGLNVGGNLIVNDGADDLDLEAENVNVGGTLNIDAGARGDSEIVLHNIDVGGQFWVRTGDGFDYVHICDVEVDLGTVIALREGDDVLEVGDSTFHSHFQASGGPEVNDTINDLGSNTFDVDPIVTQFENFGFGEGCAFANGSGSGIIE